MYEGYPYLLAEMYAYSMAAAHEQLPHLQADNYMVSAVDAGGEAWPHIDALPQVCVPPDSDGKTKEEGVWCFVVFDLYLLIWFEMIWNDFL